MGEITVSGGKNTAVAVIPAVLLCDEPCTIENLPDIDDVHALIRDFCSGWGAETEYVPANTSPWIPAARPAAGCPFPTKRLRASYYLLGAAGARRPGRGGLSRRMRYRQQAH